MITDPALQWSITVLFTVTGLYSLIRIAIAGSSIDRTSNILHVLMSASMLSMPWSWGMTVPMSWQMIVFGLAALWYLALAVLKPTAEAGPGDGHHGSRGLLLYHAFMMAAMVWMAFAMERAMAGMHGGAEMPGMEMPEMGLSTLPIDSGTAAWASAVSITLAVLFTGAALWLAARWIAQIVRGGWAKHWLLVVDPAFSALMAAGMALYFFVS
ncbi:MAG: DUF5134 domain-containing protein [Renibacterium salmoninarum]|nr:DUF5134 domain-containing protein [Renibacterium salmoninarum]